MIDIAVLFSGGLDSTVALHQAINDSDGGDVHAITVLYGSRHNERELRAARETIKYYQSFLTSRITHVVYCLPHDIFLGPATRSSLMGESEVPAAEYQDPELQGPSSTEVPFRNANLISCAVSVAMANGCQMVYLGVHASDHLRWAYPDCSPEFIGAMQAAVWAGSFGRCRLVAPFITLTKGFVVSRGSLMGVPLHMTWSCYRGHEIHCGKCPTCLERKKAFHEAGVVDSTVYSDMSGVFEGVG